VVGFVDDRMEAPLPGLPILGDRDETPELVRVHDVEAVFMACAPSWQHEMAETLAAHQPHVDLQVVPSFYEAMLRGHRVENVGDIALVPLSVAPSRLTLFLKRSFDLVCAALMLIATVPLMALVSALIKLTSRGPIIFAQERVGQHGRTFRLYKFRTMRQDAEEKTGPVLSPGSHDARMTPVGKWLRIFRIDELPQLWNVLRGEMSVVGPRPERPYFVERFAERDPVYVRRHAVRPGITGMAQVLAGYHTDARDKLRFDLIYIAHQSIGLDLKILWYTLVLIVRSRDY
jgi:exopolysaccharide biosynthesis polyprenyl glycosylphosphotransferase